MKIEKVLDEVVIKLHDYPDIALVVSSTRSMTRNLKFDENNQFLIASAVSELATNIIRYAKQGNIKLRALQIEQVYGFEVIAQDFGPGIEDINKALQDNFTSGTGLGLGLPSVKRIMDEFEIESKPDVGTKVSARKWRT